MTGLNTAEAEAAKTIGIAKITLLKWLRQGLLKEPKRANVAGVEWRVWSEIDIQQAQELKATMRRGPKPKDSSMRGSK